jgi:hypothetical protein
MYLAACLDPVCVCIYIYMCVCVCVCSFRSHYDPGVDSASNRNEYQEHFLGGKGGRCVRLTTLPPSCSIVMKSGNLNFLEPSGPLQACNGTDSPFYLFVTHLEPRQNPRTNLYIEQTNTKRKGKNKTSLEDKTKAKRCK